MVDGDTAGIAGGDESVLLVSPEAETRTLAGFMLRKLGYRVVEAQHAVEALRIFDGQPGAFDLLLVEAVMSRVNGHALAQSLHARDPRLRVLFLADAVYGRMARRVAAQKRLHFLVRPFTIAQLGAKVREALDDPRAHIQKITA